MKQYVFQSTLTAVCLLLIGCASIDRFSDRQQRRHRYIQLLRGLPEQATRAQLYAVLPPLSKSAVPCGWSFVGIGPWATESYPLDADYEVEVTFIYPHSYATDRRDPFSLRLVQSPGDPLFIGSAPSIQPRTH